MDYATSALDLARYVHSLVEKHSKNRKTLIDVSLRLIDDIQCLEDIRNECGIGNSMPELDGEIAAYQGDLRDLILDCEKLFQEKPGFRGKVKHFVKTRINVGDIEEKLIEIQKKTELAHRRFGYISQIRVRVDLSHIRAQIMGPAAELEKSLGMGGNRVADQEQELDEGFNQFDAETRYREEEWKEQENEAPASESESDEEMNSHELQSLTPKLSTLSLKDENQVRKETEEPVKPKPTKVVGRPKISHMTKDEAVQKTLALLKDIRDPESRVPVTKWISKATSLSNTLDRTLHMLPEALQLSELCSSLSRHIADEYPAAFRPLLASSLHGLAKRFWMNGEAEKALEQSQEALRIYRQLMNEDPEAYRPQLASALKTLSIDLSEVRRHDDALEPLEEAVEIRRDLAERNPEKYNPDLADVLYNYSILLSKLGRDKDALNARRELVEIREELAGQDPKRYNSSLARALKSLYSSLSQAHEYQEALKVLLRHVEVSRQVSEQDLEKNAEGIAKTLLRFSRKLAGQKHHQDALEAAEQAVELSERLLRDDDVDDDGGDDDGGGDDDDDDDDDDTDDDEEDDDPDLRSALLAESLSTMSDRLSELDRSNDALRAMERAVNLWDRLACYDPCEYMRNLATSLDKLSQKRSTLGLHEKSCRAAKFAVEKWQELADEDNKYDSDLARSYGMLSLRFSKLEKDKYALQAIEDSIDIFRELVEEKPRTYKPELAKSLITLSTTLARLERHKEAPTPIKESVDMYRQLAKENPKVYRRKLASSLHDFAGKLSRVGRKEQALKVVTEAIDIYKQLAKDKPDAYKMQIAKSTDLRIKLKSNLLVEPSSD